MAGQCCSVNSQASPTVSFDTDCIGPRGMHERLGLLAYQHGHPFGTNKIDVQLTDVGTEVLFLSLERANLFVAANDNESHVFDTLSERVGCGD